MFAAAAIVSMSVMNQISAVTTAHLDKYSHLAVQPHYKTEPFAEKLPHTARNILVFTTGNLTKRPDTI